MKILQLDSAPLVSKTRGIIENNIGDLRNCFRAIQAKGRLDFSDAIPAILNIKNNIPLLNKHKYTPIEILLNVNKFKPRFIDNDRQILPTTRELREHFIQIDKVASQDIYEDIYKIALRAQRKYNKSVNVDYFGHFFLIKILSARIGEAKNNPLFFDSPFLCINKNKYNLKLISCVSGQVVRRHPTQVKRIKLTSIQQVHNTLPDEIIEKLQLVSFKGLQETIPIEGKNRGPTTRARKVKEQQNEEFFSSDEEVTFA